MYIFLTIGNVNTLFIKAIQKWQLETVIYSVKQRVYVNQINDYGFTLLILAKFNGRVEIVKYLINNGTNTNQNNGDEFTPIKAASQNVILQY